MGKSEKKVFTIIIFIVMVFSVCITVLSLFKIPMISNDNSAKISIGEARSEVLKLTSLNEDDVVFTEQETDIKNGFRYYDFSFNDGTMSYKYRIDAHTGDVVLSSSEQID